MQDPKPQKLSEKTSFKGSALKDPYGRKETEIAPIKSWANARDGLSCIACQLPVVGEYLPVQQKAYHNECFKCEKCKETIVNSFVAKGVENSLT